MCVPYVCAGKAAAKRPAGRPCSTSRSSSLCKVPVPFSTITAARPCCASSTRGVQVRVRVLLWNVWFSVLCAAFCCVVLLYRACVYSCAHLCIHVCFQQQQRRVFGHHQPLNTRSHFIAPFASKQLQQSSFNRAWFRLFGTRFARCCLGSQLTYHFCFDKPQHIRFCPRFTTRDRGTCVLWRAHTTSHICECRCWRRRTRRTWLWCCWQPTVCNNGTRTGFSSACFTDVHC